MPKHTCATCPYFNLYGADAQSPLPTGTVLAGMEGDCRKEPPKLSSIGVPSHPRITSDWAACGAHPDVMLDAVMHGQGRVSEMATTFYESMMPAFVKMALEAGDKMEEQDTARERFHKQETCKHINKASVDGKGWVCTDCEAKLTGD